MKSFPDEYPFHACRIIVDFVVYFGSFFFTKTLTRDFLETSSYAVKIFHCYATRKPHHRAAFAQVSTVEERCSPRVSLFIHVNLCAQKCFPFHLNSIQKTSVCIHLETSLGFGNL